MSIETAADWDGLRAAAEVARLTLDALDRACSPASRRGSSMRWLQPCSPLTATAGAGAGLWVSGHGAHQRQRRSRSWRAWAAPTETRQSREARRHRRKGRLCRRCGAYRRVGNGAEVAHRLAACAVAALEAAIHVAKAGVLGHEIGRAMTHEVRRHGLASSAGLRGHGVGHTIHEPPTVPNEWESLFSATC